MLIETIERSGLGGERSVFSVGEKLALELLIKT